MCGKVCPSAAHLTLHMRVHSEINLTNANFAEKPSARKET